MTPGGSRTPSLRMDRMQRAAHCGGSHPAPPSLLPARAAAASCCSLILIAGCAAGGRGGFGASVFGPRGAPWTIQCMELDGPYSRQQIEEVAETLKRTPGIRADDVFVREHRGNLARLYYGTYYRRTDPETGRRTMPEQMRKDLNLLKQLGAGDQRYFLRAIPVRMPTPDVGNPEWDLRDVDAKYSLQVAAFEPTDEFWEHKKAAAELCAFLRQRGYEAYYYHGPAASVVTVGTFGPEAVVVGADGKTYYSDEVRALQRHELLKYNLLNGGIVKVKDPGGSSVPVPSRLVEVPTDP